MPSWSGILNELNENRTFDIPPDFDGIRRKYLAALHQHTKRNVILYASGWLQETAAPSEHLSIGDEDIQALMEVTYGLSGDTLDLILHSPGGSPEAAEAVVSYLRARFSPIRVIVPHLAMSAACMIACAADEIVLGKHSFLGPTDPQIIIPTPLGSRLVPAQAILDQFERAKEEASDPGKLSAWLPMLQQYGPDLLVQCQSALDMSETLVESWLENYMFKETSDRSEKAKKAAAWFANHKASKSHSRHISRDILIEAGLGLKTTKLETDQELQDLALSVFHVAMHTFGATDATKIVENHMGRAFIKQFRQM